MTDGLPLMKIQKDWAVCYFFVYSKVNSELLIGH